MAIRKHIIARIGKHRVDFGRNDFVFPEGYVPTEIRDETLDNILIFVDNNIEQFRSMIKVSAAYSPTSKKDMEILVDSVDNALSGYEVFAKRYTIISLLIDLKEAGHTIEITDFDEGESYGT